MIHKHTHAISSKVAIFAPIFHNDRRKMQKTCRLPYAFIGLMAFSLFSNPLNAQGSGGDNSVYLIAILVIIGALIFISAIVALSENLIQIEAKKVGLDAKQSSFSLFSFPKTLFGKPSPSFTKGAPVTKLTRGHDILLKGSAPLIIKEGNAKRYAVRPQDFRGIAPIPKVVVAVGDEVKAGDVLFHDKKDATIKYVAPVSGEIVEIRRGEKRAITEIVILADKSQSHKQFSPPSISEASREDLVAFLQESGGWTFINQRPFDVLPDPAVVPANIFISTFDTAPLAPDNNFIVAQNPEAFQKGLDVLSRLTDGHVFLGLSANDKKSPHAAFVNAEGVEKRWFAGKHPAGNVGIQIHHTAPIKGNSKVWTLGVQEVMALGELMYKGIFNAERYVVVAGVGVKEPTYVKTYIGASVGELLENMLKESNNRVIAGDVLTGRKIISDDFLNYRTDQISVIKEGDYYEMFGWLVPIKPRPTISSTFPNFLYPSLEFDGDTNTHGEKRAFVVSGQYEEVLPMHLYPQHLMKAIMTGDFEQMEGLGINELTEEDVALCEFVCTSKMPLQHILRDGLDMMREQG